MISTYQKCTTPTINKIVLFTLILIIFFSVGLIAPARIVFAASLQLEWNANPEPDLSGYRCILWYLVQ